MKSNEVMGGAVLFLFGVVTIILSLRMPIGTFKNAGTGFFPLCLGIILTALSGFFILKLIFKARIINMKKKKKAVVEAPGSTKQLIFFFGTICLVTLFFNRLGFPLASFLLMLALLRILGIKRWTFSLPLSFITAIACYLIFVQWLKIPLPKGWVAL